MMTVNDSKCNKNDKGGHDNKKWWTATRCWKCNRERGKDADRLDKIRLDYHYATTRAYCVWLEGM